MRHRKGFNHLGRTSSHRKAMLSNMAASLILHKRITTTTAKAKALRSYVEPLITKSKDDSTHSRRVVFSYLRNKFAVSELFREVSPKVADRPGGYTRILKIGNRLGDNADMCIIELVDYNENMLADEGKKAKSTRRRRAGSKKKSEEEGVVTSQAEAQEEVVTEETTPVDQIEDVAEEVVTDEQATPEDQIEDVAEEVVSDEQASPEDQIEDVVEEVVSEEKDLIVEESPAETEAVETEVESKSNDKATETEEELNDSKADEQPVSDAKTDDQPSDNSSEEEETKKE